LTKPYRLSVAGPAARSIEDGLPESVAWAVIEFVTGSLLANLYRVGKALRGEMEGTHTARRAPSE
jgi:mRNA interferase RelE/StbE